MRVLRQLLPLKLALLGLLLCATPASAESPSPYTTIWKRLATELQLTDQTQHAEVIEIADWYDKHSYYLNRVGKRAVRYLHYILHRLEAKGMPADLALLPLVESAFDPFAYSHGKAAGIWQIVPETADYLGLQRDWWFDGRRDVIDSTEAALDYLANLNRRFNGDWLLTLAAYNSGPGTVHRAMASNRKQGRPVDFWSLELPGETQHYVPKLLAMVRIFNRPEQYGLKLPDTPDRPHFSVVAIPGQLSLQQAARQAKISLDRLYHLNPGFNRDLTPPRTPRRLLIPYESKPLLLAGLRQLTATSSDWRIYRVQSHDYLGAIARKHQIDVASLKSINQLHSDVIRVGQTLLVPSPRELNYYAPPMLAGRPQIYTVQAGDTLSHIALRYDVSIKDLRRWNRLDRGKPIKIGQKLSIKSAIDQQNTVKKLGYQVVSGDSLEKIAERFQVRVRDITGWNDIDSNQFIKPGQSLTLFVDSSVGER